MNSYSRLDLIKNLPYDQQIEIVENDKKNWTESEKESIAVLLKPYFKEQSNQGIRTDLKNADKQITSAKHLVKVVTPESVNQKIAKVLGESDETVRKRNIVFEDIDKDTRKSLDSGKKSLNSVFQKTVAANNAKKPIPPMPQGKFNHIETDNGWDFGNKNIGGSGKSGAAFQYKTEPTNKIARIPVVDIAADNAVLYEYTTNQHLVTGSMLMSEYYEILNEQKLRAYCKKTTNQDKINKFQEHIKSDNELLSDILKKQKVQSDALSVMYCHGFTPKCIVTWEKEEKEGWNGFWLTNVTEHLIIGIRGDVPAFGLSEKTIVKSKYVPRTHSRKPEVMWQLIEKCVAATRWRHRKLELNCRSPRKGWHPHGDSISKKDIEEWQKIK